VDGVVDAVRQREACRLVGEAQDLWNRVADNLRAQVSEAVWLSSMQDAEPVAFDGRRLLLAVSSPLVKDRLDGRYSPLLRDALAEAGFAGVEVLVDVVAVGDPDPTPPPLEPPPLAPRAAFQPGNHAPAEDRPPVAGLTDALNPRYTFEAFVTGASNRFAHAAALSVAETPARSYNPLFIYGGAGLGKTHLLHAIGHYVRQNYPDYRVGYLSTEVFTNEFIDAIRTNTGTAFKRRYRELDVLLIDDIQFLENKEGTQEEFFHTFNSLHGSNRQIVISSDRQPDAIATLEDRLRSRFKWGLITDIQPPDLETRLAILRKKAERESRETRAPDDVLEFIASHITDNIRVLEGALIRVSAYASLNNEPLTPELAERVLGDLLTERQPRLITPAVILEATAKMFGFTVDEIKDRSRRRPLVTARQVGMYVCRELTDLSYPAIAREFGGRDHTTVIHAVEKIGALMKERRQIYNQVTELMQAIQAGD
jgi:chromosomal replication initiator protein